MATKGEGLRLINGLLADAVLLRREENLVDIKGSNSQGEQGIYNVSQNYCFAWMEPRRFGTIR
jgi:hypothetical protein